MPGRNHVRIALLGLGIAAAALCGTAAENKDQPGPGAATAKARRDAAKKVYEGSFEHLKSGSEGAHVDLAYYRDWSVRWMQAERDLSRKKAEHIAAIEGHMKRMRFWKEWFAKDGTAPPYEAIAAGFFELEAEDWLAAAKAEG